jgi:hypothetical protein
MFLKVWQIFYLQNITQTYLELSEKSKRQLQMAGFFIKNIKSKSACNKQIKNFLKKYHHNG